MSVYGATHLQGPPSHTPSSIPSHQHPHTSYWPPHGLYPSNPYPTPPPPSNQPQQANGPPPSAYYQSVQFLHPYHSAPPHVLSVSAPQTSYLTTHSTPSHSSSPLRATPSTSYHYQQQQGQATQQPPGSYYGQPMRAMDVQAQTQHMPHQPTLITSASQSTSIPPFNATTSASSTPTQANHDRAVSRPPSSPAQPSSKSQKRKRSSYRRASAADASRGSSESGGDDDEDEEEEADDNHRPNRSSRVTVKVPSEENGGGGVSGGLGPYELELLQREVDELHDEAMAERMRAEDAEARYRRLIGQLRMVQLKLDLVVGAPQADASTTASSEASSAVDAAAAPSSAAGALQEAQRAVEDILSQAAVEADRVAESSNSLTSAFSVAHARLSRFINKQSVQGERFCKPCRLVTTLSKAPFKTLIVDVQRQYTMSKRETRRMSTDEKERLVGVPLRIMGTPHRRSLYFVAKDVCILIHTRKGNVAKSIGQFTETQKARMPVLCVRGNGTVSTHILTVLTMEGVHRLLSASRSPLAPQVLRWITQQVDDLCGDSWDPPPATATNTSTPLSKPTHPSSPPAGNLPSLLTSTAPSASSSDSPLSALHPATVVSTSATTSTALLGAPGVDAVGSMGDLRSGSLDAPPLKTEQRAEDEKRVELM